jgi:hypothetical protein
MATMRVAQVSRPAAGRGLPKIFEFFDKDKRAPKAKQ